MRHRLLAILIPLLALAPLADAQNADSVAAARRAELEGIQQQAREKREAASRLKGQENQALSQLKRTDRTLAYTRKRLRDLSGRRRRLDLQLDATRMDLERNQQMLRDRRARLYARLRAMYKLGPARELELLLSTQSFAQLLSRWDWLVMVAEHDRALLQDVRERKDQVEMLERRLEGNLTQIQRTTKQTTSENQRLANQRRAKAKALGEIQTQRQSYEAAAAQLERDAQALKSLLAQLQKKRAPAPYTGDFARGQGQLEWPARGNVVGRFGLEHNPRFPKVVTPNNGIDIAMPVGTAVKSVAKGRVDYTSDDYASYGPIVILNHGDGYYTLYAHLSEIAVAVGQEVTAGQVIGRSGDTGSLKGAVLHFEVRRGATALDPQSWLQ